MFAMYTMLRVISTAQPQPSPQTKLGSSPAARTLKKLEASRVGRIKRVGQSLTHTLKRVDLEAREQFVADLRDVADAAAELLHTHDAARD